MVFYSVKGRAKCRGNSKSCLAPNGSDRVAVGTRMLYTNDCYYCIFCAKDIILKAKERADKCFSDYYDELASEKIRLNAEDNPEEIVAEEPQPKELTLSDIMSGLGVPKSLEM